MSGHKVRWLGFGLMTTVGAGVMALTAAMNSALAYGDTVGVVIGGSGLPIPGPDYVSAADQLYIDNPLNPIYPGTTYPDPYANGLFTPEGLYPLTGVHTLQFDYPADPTTGFPSLSTSVGQGMAIVENAINSNAAAGDISTVFGYSQSSTISSLVMQQLDPSGTPQPDAGLQFLLIGDPSAPNGGLLERFAGFETMSGQSNALPLSLPSLGLTFDGATPANDFPTSIYTLEYDGFADFPRYPLNFLSDLNAFLGIQQIHGTYLDQALGLSSGPTAEQIANAILLPGSALSGTADSLTNYYMIPETPPLVQLLSDIPVIGKPLSDLLGPDLTVLINMGYGSLTQGWSPDPANVPTPFGLWPTDISSTDLMNALATGAQQGLAAFENDLTNFSLSSLLPATSSATTALAATLPTFTDIVNAISSASSTAYSALLPTADIVNALLTSIPAYDVSLFTTNLASGDLVDALGLPVAADTALATLAAGFEVEIISQAVSQISADFASLFG